MSEAPRVRAFVALELDESLRHALGELQASLSPGLGSIRWVKPQSIHLTLRFLGGARPEQIAALEASLAAAALACAPFEAAVRGIGTFPEQGSPSVLWAGVELPRPALQLQKACERAAREARFEREERAFHPHLTLGRWRERLRRRPRLPPADLGLTRLERLTLFRSELRPEGAAHTALARFALGG